jgi:hypothetical protein
MAANISVVLLADAESYLALRERLLLAELREQLWKATALAMREHTNVVGVRLLKQAIVDIEDIT